MMQKLLRKKSGFTLIELMIVVVIIGVLAAVAIPAFIRFIKRSKTSEASSLIRSMFEGAVTYYNREQWPQGLGSASASTACRVNNANTGNIPGAGKTLVNSAIAGSRDLQGLGFAPSGPVYYYYRVMSAGATCGNVANSTAQYTFQAIGNLDADGSTSTFELAVGSDNENSLYHGAGMYMQDELE